MPPIVEHLVIGLDLNSSRVRARRGAAGALPQTLPLDGAQAELPLALSLEGRQVEVGRAGLRLCRRLPHAACLDFLVHLGRQRQWSAGRHCLDAAEALTRVLDHLRPACAGVRGLALALPAYLDAEQVALAAHLVEQAGTRGRSPLPPLLGSLSTPLAIALAAHADNPWPGLALVADADEHALTWAAVHVADGQVQVLDAQVLPQLSLRAWKERLLNALADRCIRLSRRDPRDSAPVEQALYEQLETALDAGRQGQMTNFVIQTPTWYQNLVLRPEELAGFCAPLARRTLAEMQALLAAAEAHGPPNAVVVTAAIGRLPGLVARLEQAVGELAFVEETELEEDFGLGLLDESDLKRSAVTVLSPDAPARAVHEVAVRLYRGELPRGHLDAAPLPSPLPPEAGAARLSFRGQEYPLSAQTFTLGRQPTCDLVFESETYPTVSARHCDIVLDRRNYVVRDRSRNGTLVNDRPVVPQQPLRPGDWIRLGPDGPQLRFLGEAADQRTLMTTA